MLGIFRTLLAIFVVIGHLHGPFELGTYAVFGFYILSGYLMTFVMRETYGYSANGRVNFAKNRFLRIFPTYWGAAALSIVLLLIFGQNITTFKETIFIPTQATEWLRNIFLVFTADSNPRLSPATWALTVELFYYIAICCGLSATRISASIWFSLSLIYTFHLVSSGSEWSARYFPIPAASLPFSIGAMIYHFKDKLDKVSIWEKASTPIILFGLICSNFVISFGIAQLGFPAAKFGFGFYMNLLLMSLIIVALIRQTPPKPIKRLDRQIGKYSYPIYLTHWQAGALVYTLSGARLNISFLTVEGFLLLFASLFVSAIFSFAIIRFIDDPIEAKRRQIKSNLRRSAPTPSAA